MPTAAETIALFRKFLYIRESQAIAQNRGLRVEAIQHWSGGVAGDSWCVELAWMVLDISFAGRPPFDRMQSCEAVRAWARAEDRMILALRPGDLYLFINAQDRAHHLGMITEVRPSSSVASGAAHLTYMGIAGNTSADGTSANGDGCYEHQISGKIEFVRIDYDR